jgi:putative ABC transport system permease protein
MVQDLRFAIRSFAKAPAFTLVAILVLAIGIGANSAMFTVVNALMFKPLSGQAGELVGLFSHDRTQPDTYRAFSYPNYADIREQTRDTFDGLMAHTFAMVGVPAGDTTRRSFIAVVSSNYFDTLGVSLAAGRPFNADEERPGAELPSVVVGYDRWRDAGFSATFLGSQIRINALDFTVVGVAPQGFTGTMAMAAPEMWLPLGMFDVVVNDMFKNRGTGLADRSNNGLIVAGRLKPDLGLAGVNARLDALSRQLEAAYPAENKNQSLSIHELPRMSTSTSPQTDTGLVVASTLLMAISGVVLVIACLNIANMLLARGTGRAKEIAIRLAVGGARGRVIRQLLTESFLLAAAGSIAGLLVAFWSTRFLVNTLSPLLPLTVNFEPAPDANVLIATTVLASLATILFGIGPALRISRVDLVNDLKGAVATGRQFQSRRWQARNVLVVGQIALSLALLCTGGLFARGALMAASANPGFRYDQLLLAAIDPSLAGYEERQGRAAHRSIIERIRAIPGVEFAAYTSTVPFGDFHEGMPVEAVGQTARSSEGRSPTYRIIGADYFRALGVGMVRGREFTAVEEESTTAPRVAIVDERLARQLFPDREPLGQMIRITRRDREAGSGNDGEPMEIVGIAPGIRDTLFDRAAVPHVYVPTGRHYRASLSIHVRTRSAGSEADVLAAIRREVTQADARVPLLDLMPMRRFHDRSLELWAVRAGGNTVISLGLLALVLAVVGVYGVKSYVVSQRTREIGIRVAVGARPQDVLWMVVREGALLTTLGLAIGLPLAAAAGVGLSKLLYEVSPLDPIVFLTAPVLLAAAALVASWLPARRATRIVPVTALRAD